MAIGIGIAIVIFGKDRDRDRDLNLGDRAHASQIRKFRIFDKIPNQSCFQVLTMKQNMQHRQLLTTFSSLLFIPPH